MADLPSRLRLGEWPGRGSYVVGEAVSHLRKADWYVAPVAISRGRSFVARHHYSKGCSNTAVYAHGLYRRSDNELMGVALWLPPTRVAAESVNRDNWKRVLALTRLAVHPDVATNGASFLMGQSIRLIRKDGEWSSLVTYADHFMGHTGAIYLATNWTLVGDMKGSPRWEDADGRQVARKATVSRTDQQMRDLGYRNVGTFGKRKFVMHLALPRKEACRRIEDCQRQGNLF